MASRWACACTLRMLQHTWPCRAPARYTAALPYLGLGTWLAPCRPPYRSHTPLPARQPIAAVFSCHTQSLQAVCSAGACSSGELAAATTAHSAHLAAPAPAHGASEAFVSFWAGWGAKSWGRAGGDSTPQKTAYCPRQLLGGLTGVLAFPPPAAALRACSFPVQQQF